MNEWRSWSVGGKVGNLLFPFPSFFLHSKFVSFCSHSSIHLNLPSPIPQPFVHPIPGIQPTPQLKVQEVSEPLRLSCQYNAAWTSHWDEITKGKKITSVVCELKNRVSYVLLIYTVYRIATAVARVISRRRDIEKATDRSPKSQVRHIR